MGNRRWSQINAAIYTVCFTGNAQVSLRCELRLALPTPRRSVPGDPDPEMQARVKAIETAVLALAARRVD